MTIATIDRSANSEPNVIQFVITLDSPAFGTETVRYRFITGSSYGSANDADIFTEIFPAQGQLTFSAGQSSATIDVPIRSDGIDELDESFTIELFDPVNVGFSGGVSTIRAIGTVLDINGSGSNNAVFVGSPIIVEGDGGQKSAQFTISLSRPAASDTSIAFQTLDGSATAGLDYTATSGTVTIAAGQQTATVNVPVLGDTSNEQLETFFLKIVPPASAPSVTASVGEATILDDDRPDNLPTISVEPHPALEGYDPTIVVRLSEPTTATVTVFYRILTNDQYGSFLDEQFTSQGRTTQASVFAVVIPAGQTSATVNLASILNSNGDSVDEVDEAFTVEFFTPINAGFGGGASALRAMVIEHDVDGGGNNTVILVGSPLVVEGNSGTKVAQFEIQLSRPLDTAVSLNYTTVDGSAVAGSDYSSVSGTVNFVAGQTKAYVNVPVLGDSAIEASETFYLKVTPPAAAPSVAMSIGEATIVADDSAVNVPVLSIEPETTPEDHAMAYVLRLDRPATTTVTVQYRFYTGDSSGSLDYGRLGNANFAIGTATIPVGSTTATIGVSMPGDLTDHIDRSLTVELFSPTNAVLAGDVPFLRAMGTVLDDDGPGANLALLVSSPLLVEGDAGASIARFEVKISRPASADITLNYATLDGTAQAGIDYTSKAGTVTIFAGQTSAFVDIAVAADLVMEATENFFLKVTPPTAAPSAVASVGEATIITDESGSGLPIISVEAHPANESGNATFIFRLDRPSTTTVSVDYEFLLNNGFGTTATADFVPNGVAPGTVTFAPGETTKTVIADSTNDPSSFTEIDEHFTMVMADPVNAVLAGDVPALLVATVLKEGGTGDKVALYGSGGVVMETIEGNEIVFTLQLSRPQEFPVTFNYVTRSGQATSGADFTAVSGTATFIAGATKVYVRVPVLDDLATESIEDFYLDLTPVTAGIGPGPLSVGAFIVDSDVVGSDAGETLNGGDFDDTVHGRGGNDILNGGAGNDYLDGGVGNDRIDGGAGNDRIVFDSLDTPAFVVGGAGIDTLLVNGSTAPVSFNLVTQGFESAEQTIVDSGNNPWSKIVSHFTTSWQLADYTTHYDNSSRVTVTLDPGNANATTQVVSYYDPLSRLVQIDRVNDNASRVIINYDPGNASPLASQAIYYDSLSRLDLWDQFYDDGRHVSINYDQANASSLSSEILYYDAQGRLDLWDRYLDNGVHQVINYDQANVGALASDIVYFDDQARLDLWDQTYDNGSRIVINYDQAAATAFSFDLIYYDNQARLDRWDQNYDNGSRVVIDYDQANGSTLANELLYFDGQARLDLWDRNFDDGTRILVDFDAADSFTWTQHVFQYAANGALVNEYFV